MRNYKTDKRLFCAVLFHVQDSGSIERMIPGAVLYILSLGSGAGELVIFRRVDALRNLTDISLPWNLLSMNLLNYPCLRFYPAVAKWAV